MLTFDPQRHLYFWQGRPVPNVTSVIKNLTDWHRIPADTLEAARQKGVAIHKMVELQIAGNLESVPEWMAGHLQAWHRFVEETGFEPWDSERRVYHPVLAYAGTLDLAGAFKRLPKVKGGAIIDLKRSLYGGPAIGLQTIAYELARNALEPAAHRTSHRFALVLKDAGTYTLTPYADPDDQGAFLACLQQYRWRQKNYPTKEAA